MHLHLRKSNIQTSSCTHVAQFPDISNQLKGFDILSAYKRAHGFRKQLITAPNPIRDDIFAAQ